MDRKDIKSILIQSVVNVVAEYGLENTTTRAICNDANLNQVYIYRHFRDLDDLLATAYLQENDRLLRKLLKSVSDRNEKADALSLQERRALLFSTAWQSLTQQPKLCKFLVYYYHSPRFAEHAREAHEAWVIRLCEVLYPQFASIADSRMSLYVFLGGIYSFAKQVADGLLPNTEETKELVFRNICAQAFALQE